MTAPVWVRWAGRSTPNRQQFRKRIVIDLVIVLAFMAYAISAGFSARRQASRSLSEYFLAGRTLRGWRAGVSMAATQFAADTPLLVVGLIATGGLFLVWQLWVYGIAFLLLGFLFAGKWRRAAVLTDAELMELRYSGHGRLALRVLKAFYYGTVINCVVMAFVLVAGVRIAEVFLPWHDWLPAGLHGVFEGIVVFLGLDISGGVTALPLATASANNLISILLLLGFTALYATTGGLRSVIATDIVQFALAMIGTLVYAVIVVREVGGFAGLGESLVELYGLARAEQFLSFSPGATDLMIPLLVIFSLQWLFQMNSDGTGYLAQRSMACATDPDARLAAVVFSWLQIVFRSLLWLVIGVSLLVLFPIVAGTEGEAGFTAEREMAFVAGLDDHLPPGIKGLMLTGLLAALASTLDTHLNWGASYWSNDIYKRALCGAWLQREPDDRELVLVARSANILIMVIALAIMTQLESIQEGWKLSLLFGAGIGSVLVLRWVWERINLYSELAAIVVSFIAGLWLLWVWPEPENEWLRLGTMALISTLATVGITFVTPATSPEVLAEFYRRVRPGGFWARTAASLGEDPALARGRLGDSLMTTALAAASLFLALYGFGRLLLHLPHMALWPAWLALVVSAGLIPFWWRRVRFHASDHA
jgi:solute:Na+ symporter, SSS family